MADRNFHPAKGYLEIGMVCLFGEASIGATGAVDSFSSKGLDSLTRTGVGAYTLGLEDSYNKLMFLDANFEGTVTATDGNAVAIVADSVSTVGAPQVTLQFFDAAGAAADPAASTTLRLKLALRNSSVD